VELGELREAAQHFRASTEIEPKAEIFSDYGFTLARLGDAAGARAAYEQALTLDPTCASAHLNLAVAAVQAGDLPRAEAHYRKALPGRPTAETHNGLGFVLGRQGRREQAIAEFRKAIELDARFTPAYNNLADALASQGRLEEAARYYRESLARKPSPAVQDALTAVLTKLGKASDAGGAQDSRP
jgi:superkiller protein 3